MDHLPIFDGRSLGVARTAFVTIMAPAHGTLLHTVSVDNKFSVVKALRTLITDF
jgi:hypothetical protein